jgi:hypothetical protein
MYQIGGEGGILQTLTSFPQLPHFLEDGTAFSVDFHTPGWYVKGYLKKHHPCGPQPSVVPITDTVYKPQA